MKKYLIGAAALLLTINMAGSSTSVAASQISEQMPEQTMVCNVPDVKVTII